MRRHDLDCLSLPSLCLFRLSVTDWLDWQRAKSLPRPRLTGLLAVADQIVSQDDVVVSNLFLPAQTRFSRQPLPSPSNGHTSEGRH